MITKLQQELFDVFVKEAKECIESEKKRIPRGDWYNFMEDLYRALSNLTRDDC